MVPSTSIFMITDPDTAGCSGGARRAHSFGPGPVPVLCRLTRGRDEQHDGDCARDWPTYLALDWPAGVGAETYGADLCELVVWEDLPQVRPTRPRSP